MYACVTVCSIFSRFFCNWSSCIITECRKFLSVCVCVCVCVLSSFSLSISLQSLLDFPPILTNLAPVSQPQATVTNAIPTLPLSSFSSSQPFTLPPPPSSQFPISTAFGGSSSLGPQFPVPPSTSMSQPQTTVPSNATSTAKSAADLLGDLSLDLNLGQPPQPAAAGIMGQPSVSSAAAPQAWGAFQSDPLAVISDLFVPKDKIQPSMYSMFSLSLSPSLSLSLSLSFSLSLSLSVCVCVCVYTYYILHSALQVHCHHFKL